MAIKFNDIVNMKTAIFGAVVGTVTYLISWLATMLGIGARTFRIGDFVAVTGSLLDVNVRAQIESSGVANQFGASVLQLLRFVPNLKLGHYLTVVVGSIALVMLGKWIYVGMNQLPRGTAKTRIFLQLLYGATAFTVIVAVLGGLFSIPAFMGLLIAMAIYYGLVAFVLWAIVSLNFLGIGKFING